MAGTCQQSHGVAGFRATIDSEQSDTSSSPGTRQQEALRTFLECFEYQSIARSRRSRRKEPSGCRPHSLNRHTRTSFRHVRASANSSLPRIDSAWPEMEESATKSPLEALPQFHTYHPFLACCIVVASNNQSSPLKKRSESLTEIHVKD